MSVSESVAGVDIKNRSFRLAQAEKRTEGYYKGRFNRFVASMRPRQTTENPKSPHLCSCREQTHSKNPEKSSQRRRWKRQKRTIGD